MTKETKRHTMVDKTHINIEMRMKSSKHLKPVKALSAVVYNISETFIR
jgi:hypothetical protein